MPRTRSRGKRRRNIRLGSSRSKASRNFNSRRINTRKPSFPKKRRRIAGISTIAGVGAWVSKRKWKFPTFKLSFFTPDLPMKSIVKAFMKFISDLPKIKTRRSQQYYKSNGSNANFSNADNDAQDRARDLREPYAQDRARDLREPYAEDRARDLKEPWHQSYNNDNQLRERQPSILLRLIKWIIDLLTFKLLKK